MSSRTRLLAAASVLVALGASAVPFYYGPAMVTYWADRDVLRGDTVWSELPWTGAELNYGGGARVPGPAWAVMMWLLRLPGLDPSAVHDVLRVGQVGAAAALAWVAARRLGPAAGATVGCTLALPSQALATLDDLYNPTGLPPLVVAAMAALSSALAYDRKRDWLIWSGLMAIAAQLHLTALTWWAWTLLGLVPVVGRRSPRAIGLAVLAFAVAYTPYVLGEAAHGWVNSLAMLDQDPVTGVWRGVELPWTELRRTVEMLLPAVPGPLAGPVAVFVGGLALSGLVSAFWADGDPWVRAVIAPTLAVTLTPALLPTVHLEERYVLLAAYGWAVLAGAGLAAVSRELRARAALVAPVLLTAVALWTNVGAPANATQPGVTRHTRPGHWTPRRLAHTVRAIDAVQPGDLADVAGRTAMLRDGGAGLELAWGRSITWLLAEEGLEFPGSLPEPCWLITDGQPVDEAAYAALLRRAWVRFEPAVDVPGIDETIQVTRYTLDGGRCPTTMGNRYVDTSDHRRLRDAWRHLQLGASTSVTLGEGQQVRLGAWHGNLPGAPGLFDLVVGAELHVANGRLTGRVHVPQLAGAAFNGGWLSTWAGSRPRLVLRGATEHVIPLDEGIVGGNGILGPYPVDAAVPPDGDWDVLFLLDPIVPPWPEAPLAQWTAIRRPILVRLGRPQAP